MKGRPATTRERLAAEATRLRKVYIRSVACLGTRAAVPREELAVAAYDKWTRKLLQREVDRLRESLTETLTMLASPPDRRRAIDWLCERYDAWDVSAHFDLASAEEFEARLGPLKNPGVHIPPYARLVIQGIGSAPDAYGNVCFIDLAVRHPEYHPARDLSLLQNCFKDSEILVRRHLHTLPRPPWWAGACENNQTLARATVLACFNLLEGFVLGLSREFISRGSLSDDEIRRLNNRKPLVGPLTDL